MIHLITGTPGSGKTLYALNYVQTLAEDGKRPVYYDGIADLTLPWELLADATQWANVPQGSIIVIDEAQRIFRPRGNGAVVPPHVAALETHRHQGLDIVVITQHPMLLDTNLRRLVGRHFHVVRAFGMQRATIHEWAEVKVQCDVARSDSVKHLFAYPPASFGWYKSAEVHTHKRRIPMRLFFMLLLPLMLGGLAYGVSVWFSKKTGDVPKVTASSPQLVPAQSSGKIRSGPVAIKSPLERTVAYASSLVPAVAGFPHTADRYESVTQPKQAPVPVACVSSASSGCKCYSQQATRLVVVDQALCLQIVADGFFMDWVEPPQRGLPLDSGAPGARKAAGSPLPAQVPAVALAAVPEGAAVARPEAAPVVPAHNSTRYAISGPPVPKK